MDELKFDVMLNGRYVCSMTYKHCRAFVITEKEITRFVEEKRPSLKARNGTLSRATIIEKYHEKVS